MVELPPIDETQNVRPPEHPGLDLVRATEAAALAAGRWMGLDDRYAADHAAQEAMATALNLLPMKGRIISGEEGRVGGHTPLDSESMVGTGSGPELDVEVNAIDGATLVAEGQPGAMAIAALAPSGSLWHPGPAVYMEKIVVDRRVADSLGPEALDAPAGWTLATVARAKNKDIRDLVVFILDRPRHKVLIHDVRKAGARVLLRSGGDVGGGLLAADPRVPVDILMGVGGAAEGLITACAVKALGGAMLSRVAPQSQTEKQACNDGGVSLDRIFTCGELVKGNEVYFAATGITDGMLLKGVEYHGNTVDTHSLILRYETGTRRIINTEYRLK